MLSNASVPSYNGQFSYFNDLIVATETDAAGVDRMSIAVKINQ